MTKRPIDYTDRRYTMRLRRRIDPDISLNPFDAAEAALGVWDTVDECFVKRDAKSGEWVTDA